MRRRTRNVVLGSLAVVALLLAAVAGIGALGSGEPYYVTAERTATGTAIGGESTGGESTDGDRTGGDSTRGDSTGDDGTGGGGTGGGGTGGGGTAGNVSTGNRTAVNGTDLPTRRFPFTTGALEAARSSSDGVGRSSGYRTGPIGIKEFFSHSPFDELDALRQRNPGASVGDGVLVRRGNVTYRVTIVQEASEG